MATKNKSPLPNAKKPETMDFYEALKKVADGEKITKLEWGSNEIFGILRDGELQFRRANGDWQQWVISGGDLAGEDWVVVVAGIDKLN